MQTFVNQPPYQLGYGAVFPKLTYDVMSKEKSLSGCSEAGVNIHGGFLTRIAMKHILAAFENDIRKGKEAGLSAVVDVHVQYLLTGMFPDAPGWHCDGVPRGAYHGQPMFDAVNPLAFHVAVVLSTEAAGVSNTEFVMDAIRPKVFAADHVYRDLHEQVEKIAPKVAQINDGVFVRYTPKTIHRAVESSRRGWRMFLRYSLLEKPPIYNNVAVQQQVYLVADKADHA